MPRRLVHCLPAPLLEAGAGTGSSPASFRTHSGARMAQDRRKAPVLMALPLLDRGYRPKLAFVAGGLFGY
jgi:hypothetical protein